MPREYTCAACGQVINPLSDSYNLVAGRPRHVTCPTSPALANLAPAPEAAPSAAAGRPDYMTSEEAAAMLRVTVRSIRRMVADGRLPAKRLRGARGVLIERGDLLALLEDAREGVAA